MNMKITLRCLILIVLFLNVGCQDKTETNYMFVLEGKLTGIHYQAVGIGVDEKGNIFQYYKQDGIANLGTKKATYEKVIIEEYFEEIVYLQDSPLALLDLATPISRNVDNYAIDTEELTICDADPMMYESTLMFVNLSNSLVEVIPLEIKGSKYKLSDFTEVRQLALHIRKLAEEYSMQFDDSCLQPNEN
jgi:hypothetical protein